MIFVSLGTSPFQFERLVKIADAYKELTGEDVFIQIGYTKYIPKDCRYTQFLSKEDYIKNIRSSEVVIAHAGMGIILDCLRNHKNLILVPRVSIAGEHTDDHQLEIAHKMKEQMRANVILPNNNIREAISIIKNSYKNELTFEKNKNKDMLISKLSKYIEELDLLFK